MSDAGAQAAPPDDDDDQRPRLLKVYGRLIEHRAEIVARIGAHRRHFPIANVVVDATVTEGGATATTIAPHNEAAIERERRRARRAAVAYLHRYSLEHKRVNRYEIEGPTARVLVYEIGRRPALPDKTRAVVVDVDDLHAMRERIWWLRVRMDGSPVYVYASARVSSLSERTDADATTTTTATAPTVPSKRGRLLLANLLTGVGFDDAGARVVQHVNGDVLDCRRRNLTVVDVPPPPPSAASHVDAVWHFERFCFPDGPYIPRPYWERCRRFAAQSDAHRDNVARALSACLAAHYLELPQPHYSDAEIIDNLMVIDGQPTATRRATTAVGKVVRDSDGTDVYALPTHNSGQLLCRHFMKDAILNCGYRTDVRGRMHRCPVGIWRDDAWRTRLCENLLSKLNARKILNTRTLWREMCFRFYIASNFKPLTARAVYDRYCTRGGARVLDLCSGWGGRFVGFWFSTHVTHYVGIDPNPRLRPRYARIAEWLRRHFSHGPHDRDADAPPKTFQFVQQGAEHPLPRSVLETAARSGGDDTAECVFDLVFTSPPYFDVEIYHATDSAQSCNAYGESYEQWCDGFLHPALRNAYTVLRIGGHVALNVADTRRCPTLVADTTHFCTETLHMRHVETLHIPLSRRPGVGSKRQPWEPVLVFQKVA